MQQMVKDGMFLNATQSQSDSGEKVKQQRNLQSKHQAIYCIGVDQKNGEP
jgi:hypothetical protein